jgi:hypothetical protein
MIRLEHRITLFPTGLGGNLQKEFSECGCRKEFEKHPKRGYLTPEQGNNAWQYSASNGDDDAVCLID